MLYNFDATGGTPDGVRPYAGLVPATDGSFSSVTSAGGTNAAGTLYKITSTGVVRKIAVRPEKWITTQEVMKKG